MPAPRALAAVDDNYLDAAGVPVLAGGPPLYLASVGGFKWLSRCRSRPPLSHLVGLLLAVLAGMALQHWLSALALGAGTTAVLLMAAVWEHLSLRRRSDLQ